MVNKKNVEDEDDFLDQLIEHARMNIYPIEYDINASLDDFEDDDDDELESIPEQAFENFILAMEFFESCIAHQNQKRLVQQNRIKIFDITN